MARRLNGGQTAEELAGQAEAEGAEDDLEMKDELTAAELLNEDPTLIDSQVQTDPAQLQGAAEVEGKPKYGLYLPTTFTYGGRHYNQGHTDCETEEVYNALKEAIVRHGFAKKDVPKKAPVYQRPVVPADLGGMEAEYVSPRGGTDE